MYPANVAGLLSVTRSSPTRSNLSLNSGCAATFDDVC
jgi:hypothetical protein